MVELGCAPWMHADSVFPLWPVAMGREFGLMALNSALVLLQLMAWFDEKGGTVHVL